MSPRVALIDADERRAIVLAAKLTDAGYADVVFVDAQRLSIDTVLALKPDLIVMDMAQPERDTLESVRHLAGGAKGPIVMFSDADDPSFVAEAIAAGVSSYNLSGVSSRDMKTILAAATAIYRRQAGVASELAAATAALAERRIIERAKAELMAREALSEPQAYRRLRTRAMKESRKIADIAAAILTETGESAALKVEKPGKRP